MKTMKSTINLLFVYIALLVLAAHTAAHPGGHSDKQGIGPAEAVSIGLNAAHQYTETDPGFGFGNLNPSWKKLGLDAARIEHVGNDHNGKEYCIVRVDNQAEKKTLYIVLYTDARDIYDANLTGNFPKLSQ